MSNHTHSSLFFHIVWATKKKVPFIKVEFRKKLHKFIGKNIVMRGWHPIAINGTDDHVHVLLQLFPNHNISNVVGSIKANSSRFVRDNFDTQFCWQGGFAIFTVDIKLLSKIKKYILNQEEHHSTKTFNDEFKLLLIRNKLKYGEYIKI